MHREFLKKHIICVYKIEYERNSELHKTHPFLFF